MTRRGAAGWILMTSTSAGVPLNVVAPISVSPVNRAVSEKGPPRPLSCHCMRGAGHERVGQSYFVRCCLLSDIVTRTLVKGGLPYMYGLCPNAGNVCRYYHHAEQTHGRSFAATDLRAAGASCWVCKLVEGSQLDSQVLVFRDLGYKEHDTQGQSVS